MFRNLKFLINPTLHYFMKITRFAQSSILIETEGKRILLDPGNLQYKESYLNNEWNNIDILLITHKHGDHCHL
ncbi:MAG: MBL fold metallo-hydrolase, partial [Nanoarchaeota archaeon]|nr:MBL fold metallo-hydrolase [Nanoarchaeota archaeon]